VPPAASPEPTQKGPSEYEESVTGITHSTTFPYYRGLEVTSGVEVFDHAVNTYHLNLTPTRLCDSCFAPPVAQMHHRSFLWECTFYDVSEGAASRTWLFPDGSQDTSATAHYSFPAAGTYPVCLLVENGCGTDSICDSITVACATPFAAFSWAADTSSGTVVFENQSQNALDWNWTFGVLDSTTTPNPNFNFEQNGTYAVCLTASSYCGSDQVCDSVVVNFTSIQDWGTSQIKVYPNPVSDVLTIQGKQLGEKVSLLDAQGRQVGSTLKNRISLSHLEPGIYFLQIEGQAKTHIVLKN